MADRRIPLEKRKYLLKDSDRSGFTHYRRELVKDGAVLVHPDEKDDPPPHPHYIGGEGERGTSDSRSKTKRENLPETKTEIWSP
jgi:hypothetical protein